MSFEFELHPTLQKDLIDLGDLELCKLMVLPDSDNPWVVLVPIRENIKELHHLSKPDQQLLLKEIDLVSQVLESKFKPDKINIGALGNMVPQLHIHIICRYQNDRAWPGAIWGTKTGEDEVRIDQIVQSISNELLEN